ncbi:MAG: alpha-ketoacid dehydrogenase subunit beta [Chloroflexi bacterium]|nr:alpha-ketoacid dehydrogenase subunit beta [Chloroflexota bacterium]MDA8219299.1 alpha-ketoacid dehydrogenase subunit beta [Dehalococcoidales bacterium]
MAREITYLQAIGEALSEEMGRDPDVFVMGEDVASPTGKGRGVRGEMTGLPERFGFERVRNTPISESALIGAALGAALTGSRPVVELMFVDLACVCMDQIVNQVAKVRYMFGGKARVPLVIRVPSGAGAGAAGHHSQSLENWFVHTPGLLVVAPSSPYDAKGLLKTAIRDDNPIVFVEHKALYGLRGTVPDDEYLVPLGVAEVKRPGKDVTVVATSRQVHNALMAAETLAREGIEATVIDPRTLKPLDVETILASVRQTHRCLVVNEGCKTGGYASELAAVIGEEAFGYLDAPVLRVAAEDVPIPANRALEDEAIPQVRDIIAAARTLAGAVAS